MKKSRESKVGSTGETIKNVPFRLPLFEEIEKKWTLIELKKEWKLPVKKGT